MICLDEMSPNETTIMAVITLNTNENDKNTPCYLPAVNHEKNNNSELILLSIVKPHI